MIDEEIIKNFEKRDLKSLESFCTPTYREINKSQNYKSVLMLSCNNPKHLNKIISLEADCIMLNLEDGVSKEDKPFALVLCAIVLSKLKKCDKKLVVRVNSLDTTGYDEIAYLNQYMPDAIRVPKIKTKNEVESILALLHDEIELHLSIETKEAWYNLKELKPHKMVKAFYLGILDMFADMGLAQVHIKKDNPTMLYMLPHFLTTCLSMDVKPVSFVYQDYKKLDEFKKWVMLEKEMGFSAKGCISPKQVEIVNELFGADTDEIQKAKEIVELFEANQEKGITGFSHDKYGFIDEPIYKGALSVLGRDI
jgi:citrate lyase subunit beta/citryl-CoA lyase